MVDIQKEKCTFKISQNIVLEIALEIKEQNSSVINYRYNYGIYNLLQQIISLKYYLSFQYLVSSNGFN